MRFFRKWLLWLAAGTVGPVVLFLAASILGGLIAGPLAPVAADEAGARRVVGLLAGPIHNDFVLALDDDLRRRFAFAAEGDVPIDDPDAAFLIVGWGAREFYTTTGTMGDIAPGVVWRAMVGDRSVMRVDVWGAFDPESLPTYRALRVTEAQYQALLEGVEAGFATDPASGRPVLVKAPGFYPTDAFFAGRERFHLFNTCNVWVGRQLRAAGVRFGLWTPATWSVDLSLWRFAGG